MPHRSVHSLLQVERGSKDFLSGCASARAPSSARGGNDTAHLKTMRSRMPTLFLAALGPDAGCERHVSSQNRPNRVLTD
jgi:hypothetical protein